MIIPCSIGETTRPIQCECVLSVIFNFVIAAASSELFWVHWSYLFTSTCIRISPFALNPVRLFGILR